MVARTPLKQQKKMVVPLNSTQVRETVNKVDKCMARLQELQYTVAGGTKVISGVSLSPRSTRGYLRTSLRCKQETLRIKNANSRRSSPGKFPTNTEEWRRMSLPAMLVGETVGEIIKASQFARETMESVSPKTPGTLRRNPDNSELRARRKREKQTRLKSIQSESELNTPSLQRARSRINFKVSSPPKKREKEERENNNIRYLANRVSPKNRPWARKAVIFPNPLFHSSSSSPTSHRRNFNKTTSPVIAGKVKTPHKFLIKSPPPLSVSPTRPKAWGKKSPPKVSTAAKLRRSFSPSRLATRLVSPLKSRRLSVQKSDGEGLKMKMMMSGLRQRPISTPMQFSARRS